jgi:hypothetical protein
MSSHEIFYEDDILKNTSLSCRDNIHVNYKISSIEIIYGIHNTNLSATMGLELITAAINIYFPTCKYQLFAGSDAWNDKNRITMYNKLWKSILHEEDIAIPNGEICHEYYIEHDHKIKFFSSINLDKIDIPATVKFMRYSKANILICSLDSKFIDPGIILPNGWGNSSFYNSMPIEILYGLYQENVLCCSTFGSFDDRDAGVILFGAQENIYNIKNHL